LKGPVSVATRSDQKRRIDKAKAAYDKQKSQSGSWSRRLAAAGRDIGSIPPPKNKSRRESCRNNFRLFCETYAAEAFPLAWSPDHLRAIEKIEGAVLRGELFAFAFPRGSGKTTMAEWACIWSMLYGHRRFVMLIGSDQAIACQMLDSIKTNLEQNDLLLEDFPAACFPIRAMEGITRRAQGQTCEGEPTHIEWTADQITLPWIGKAESAGAAVRVAGITGRIRGIRHTRPDGATVRPSLVLIDDPQTDESAASPSQVATREKILSGAILGLAGPGAKIAGLCTITVIRPDDLADRLLDRAKHPAWQGERTMLVYEWPKAEELWGQYAETRRQGQRDGQGTQAADDFYVANREAMDAGARVAWPERKNPDEISAIQHAWNLRIDRGESAFFAEYQNQPLADDIASDKLDKRSLALRSINLARGVVPSAHNTLTAFVDVQDKLLFWLVASWSESFGGHVVAYGAYPDQGSSFFEASHAKRTLAAAAKGAGPEGALRAGLDNVARQLLSADWKREDGAKLRIDRMLVDANWGQTTTVVRTFCKQSPFAAQIIPSHGRFVGASSQPMTEKQKHRGDKMGLNWRIGKLGDTDHRSALYDTNFWKSFAAARLRLAIGDPEALTLHQGDHDMLIEHLTSEYPVRTEARGRVVDEWKTLGRDNHWWDCLVGAAVAASITGLQPTSSESGGRRRRKVEMPTGTGRKVITVKRLGT
jgi:hypothetical protein